MKFKIFALFLVALSITGCANVSPFSPKNPQKINNQGKIEEIKSNQNGIMAEIGKLKQDAQILDSQLKEIQSGLVNINSAISRNENNGVQILQGDGSLILVFALVTVGMLLLWYRNRAVISEKNLSIMAKEVVKFNNTTLNDEILSKADSEGMGKKMLKVLTVSFE